MWEQVNCGGRQPSRMGRASQLLAFLEHCTHQKSTLGSRFCLLPSLKKVDLVCLFAYSFARSSACWWARFSALAFIWVGLRALPLGHSTRTLDSFRRVADWRPAHATHKTNKEGGVQTNSYATLRSLIWRLMCCIARAPSCLNWALAGPTHLAR